jgi:penicillin-binding protein 1B
MIKKKSHRLAVRVLVYGGIVLLIACAIFVVRGRQRLLDLMSHTSRKTTNVYSAWLTLAPDDALTHAYVIGTLDVLGYENSPGPLVKSGQYRDDNTALEIWTRGFDFADQSFAPRRIRLSFSSGHLSQVETLPENHPVAFWRLEPKRLAQWAAKGGASQPQIRLEDLPMYVPKAVVAIEDKRFYQHGAIDLRGLARAVWVDLRGGGLRQGGSTITQQLSRSIFLDVRRTWSRKILEAGLAFFLEAVYSKTQLLEMYLNQVYWGQDGADSLLGLESASRSYFGHPARELTLGQSAMLAGMLQSPNNYSPRANPKIARERRNLVLALMFGQGFISPEQFKAALLEPITPTTLRVHAGDAPYFVASLQDNLLQKYTLNILLTQGWNIFTTLDPLLQTQATAAMHPSEGQAALVALDPRTGAVRAWVGGTNYGQSTYDRVLYAKRQPGSAFKPFVMLAAIDTRKATEATFLEDTPLTVKTPQGIWKPQNYDRKFRGRVSLWDALVLSLNIPTVRLVIQTGPDKIVEYARRLGIQSPLRAVPSIALGTSEVSVLELTSAYGTLANTGRSNAPYTIESIQDLNKQLVASHTPETQDAVSDASAFIMTHLLQGVFEEGTAKHARELGFTFPAAGKTGTSENYQDAWFIGYTSRLACGVWVGYDHPKPMGRAAAGIALPVWTSFMEKALALWPADKLAEPPGLIWKTIDIDSGELARSGCPHRRKDVFLSGTEPDKMCTLHPGGIIGLFYRWRNK